MTVDDAVARLLRSHVRVVLACVLVPVLIVVGLHVAGRSERLYASTERLQLGLQVASSNVEADAISSRAAALAGSAGFVQAAVTTVKVQRDVDALVADRVRVRRVGLSAVVDLTVTDPSPQVAHDLTAALGREVMAFLDTAGRQPEIDALRALDQHSSDLSTEREGVLQAAKLDPPPAEPAPGTKVEPLAQALDELSRERSRLTVQRLTALDQELGELASQRGKLTLEQAARPAAAVVAAASLPVHPEPSGLPQALELALLLGVLLALAAAGALELVRPTVPSPRSLARLLRAPLLGQVAASRPVPARIDELVQRVALTARRHEVGAVVLVPVHTPDQVLALLVETGAGLTRAPALVPAQAPVAAHGPGRPAAGPSDLPAAGPQLHWHATSRGRADQDAGWEEGYGRLDARLARDQRRAGGVLVAPDHLHLRDLDHARDLFEATGWPLLGIITVSGGSR